MPRNSREKKIIVENPENVPTKILADSIVKVADGMREIRSSGLTDRALILLIAHACGQSQAVVKQVLYGIEQLKRQYVR